MNMVSSSTSVRMTLQIGADQGREVVVVDLLVEPQQRGAGSSSAAGELSTSITTSPSMMQAVATSGRSVYRTVGNGFQNCRGAMASTMDS